MDQDAQASWSLVTGCHLVCPLNVKSCDFVTSNHSCPVRWGVHLEQQPAVWLAGSGCVSSHGIIFVGVEHYRMTCRPHPLLFFLWVWHSFRWPLTAYRGSRFSDASAVWTQNITERSVDHRMACHAFLHGCHRLLPALPGSGLTAMITQDERCIIRTMLYNHKHKAENDWAAGCLIHVSQVINGKCPVSASTKSKLLHYHARVYRDTHVAFFSCDCDVKQILSLKEPWRTARVPGAAVWPSGVLTFDQARVFFSRKKNKTKGKTPKPRALKCLLSAKYFSAQKPWSISFRSC